MYIECGQMSNKYTHTHTSNDVIFVNYFYPMHLALIYPLERGARPPSYYYQ